MLARYRKFAVAVLGGAATIAVAIPQDTSWGRWAQVVIAVATAAGVYGVRNAPSPSPWLPVASKVDPGPSRIATERPPVPPPPDPGKRNPGL